MSRSWQENVRNALKSNTRIIVKDGKRTMVSFISWKKIQEIIRKEKNNGYNIAEEVVVEYVERFGLIVPYKVEDIDKIYKLADMQEEGKKLQDFEKNVCKAKVDELAKKYVGELIPDEAVLELGLCTPLEVKYALFCSHEINNQLNIQNNEVNSASINTSENESLEDKNTDSYYKRIIENNEDFIKQEIEKILIKKEIMVLNGADFHSIGGKNLLTGNEIKLVLKKIRINTVLSDDNKKIIYNYIDDVRNKRKQLYINDAVSSYKELCSEISKRTGEEVINYSKEEEFMNNVDSVINQSDASEKERIAKIKENYLNSRKVIYYYYEKLIHWATYQVKKNSASAINVSDEDLMMIISEFYLKSYYDFIRKDIDHLESELTTYIINNITSDYKNLNKVIYAGERLSNALYQETLTMSPFAKSNVGKRASKKYVIDKTLNSLTSKLGRKPTYEELALSLGLSVDELKEQLDDYELINRGVDSLDEMNDSIFADCISYISDDMQNAIEDGYNDHYENDFDESLALDDDLGIAYDEEGVVPDYMEEEEIVGHNNSIFENIFRRDILDKALSELNPRESEIVELRTGYKDGINRSLKEVAEIYGVTRSRIQQIESLAYIHLFSILSKYDVNDLLIDYDYYNPMTITEERGKNK